MESLALVRAIHVVAVVLWIGGVAMVTTVLLPAIRRLPDTEDPVDLFERIEGRFARQARVVTLVTALSGFYLVYRLDAWGRYLTLNGWWLVAMTGVWFLFTLILFVLEPYVLKKALVRRAAIDPHGTLALIHRAHWGLLTLSLVTVAGAVAGSHGWAF